MHIPPHLTHFIVLTSIIVSHNFFLLQTRVYWNTSSLRSEFTSQKLESIVTRGNCSVHCTEHLAVTQMLYLKNITGADNGYVKCIAENIVGKSDDSSSLLKINCELAHFQLPVISFQALRLIAPATKSTKAALI